jgi:hypothetical protein
MSYQAIVASDSPVLYYKADESSSPVIDRSGALNNGSYSGSRQSHILPLISGHSSATKITNLVSISAPISNNYSGIAAPQSFGIEGFEKESFSLEGWFHPKISTASLTPLFADSENSVGLFYEAGNIVFLVDTLRLDYTVPYLNKSIHVVGVYSGSYMYIYIDGILKALKSVSSVAFTNTELNLGSGPTLDSVDSFLVNGLAVYRYALEDFQIKKHYDAAQTINGIQIASVNSGEFFQLFDNGISTQFSYSYPAKKGWEYFITDDLEYNPLLKSIRIASGTGVSKTVVIEDLVPVPSGLAIDDSIIEWSGDNGVSVETSLDGETYETCINGRSIPQYSIDGTISEGISLYVKITLQTSDDSKYLPQLNYLSLSFYNSQKIYAKNSSSYVSKITDATVIETNLGDRIYPVLSRNNKNGIKTVEGSGFYINTESQIKTLEFFYTPDYLNNDLIVAQELQGNLIAGLLLGNVLDNGYDTHFAWDEQGNISKSNIASIYVNGVVRTFSTDIADVFVPGEIHHVVIVLADAISGSIKINAAEFDSIPALYQNLSIYTAALTATNILDNYDSYLGNKYTSVVDLSLSMQESEVYTYDIDWVVVQSS